MSAPDGAPRTSPFFWNEEVRPGLRVAFTSAAAGNLALHVGDRPDDVELNRRRLAASMDVAAGTLRFMSQTHSDRVAVVDSDGTADLAGTGVGSGPLPPAPDADSLVSVDGLHPLAVLVADCVPVVLADTRPSEHGSGARRSTAVVHAGRAGVANGIVGKAVAVLRRQGAQHISAWIGPSVCGSCYEVPEAMMLEVARLVPEAAARTRSGTASLDLPAAVRVQLLDVGVTVEAVPAEGVSCTLENHGLFSHRRQSGAGRIAGLVWRT